MSRWFRIYDDVLDNPKVQKLSDAAFRAWINLMCIASKNAGLLEDNIENISFSLRKSKQKTRDLLQILQSAGLLDIVESGWKPHNWDKRQYRSDVSTDRVRRFRERHETVSETPPEQIQNRTEQSRVETPPVSLQQETSSQINRLVGILGLPENDFTKHAANIRALVDLKNEGCDFDAHILPAAQGAAKSRKTITSLNYIAPKARELRDSQKVVSLMPTPFVDTDVRGWNDRLAVLEEHGRWEVKWGPPPDNPACKIPVAILASYLSKKNGKANAGPAIWQEMPECRGAGVVSPQAIRTKAPESAGRTITTTCEGPRR